MWINDDSSTERLRSIAQQTIETTQEEIDKLIEQKQASRTTAMARFQTVRLAIATTALTIAAISGAFIASANEIFLSQVAGFGLLITLGCSIIVSEMRQSEASLNISTLPHDKLHPLLMEKKRTAYALALSPSDRECLVSHLEAEVSIQRHTLHEASELIKIVGTDTISYLNDICVSVLIIGSYLLIEPFLHRLTTSYATQAHIFAAYWLVLALLLTHIWYIARKGVPSARTGTAEKVRSLKKDRRQIAKYITTLEGQIQQIRQTNPTDSSR